MTGQWIILISACISFIFLMRLIYEHIYIDGKKEKLNQISKKKESDEMIDKIKKAKKKRIYKSRSRL